MNFWVLLAVAIIVALAAYAAFLYIKLYRQNVRRKKNMAELEASLEEKSEHSRKSIQIIASALLSDTEEITLTEAAIRISVLSRQLNLPEAEKGDYQPFHQLAKATAHIPVLDEWKKLSREDKHRLDKERVEIEKMHCEFVMAAAKDIVAGGNSESSR